MNQHKLDLYTDYLSVTFGQATATGLSNLLNGEMSHDAITRFLSERDYTSKDLWKQVKGINLLNCLYHVNGVSIPVAFELVRKNSYSCELDTRQEKRVSAVTKNEQMRAMIDACVHNQLKFKWILADTWFASTENMKHIKQTHGKDFVMALKSNRLVALRETDRKQKTTRGLTNYPGQNKEPSPAG
jgi:SRSO17 transposase